MITRYRHNQIKIVLFIILFTILALAAHVTQAQSFTGPSDKTYRGFVASFGTRSVNVSSNIARINQTNLMAAGGQAGVIFGNSTVRAKIGLLGYYSSTGNTAGTTDLYESNASVNFFPLSLITSNSYMIEPYLTGGVSFDRFKFFGFYINQEPGVTNHSQIEAPYIGKIKQVNATVGLGIEVKLRDKFDFIHLFSEVKYGHNLSSQALNNTLAGTSLNNQMQVILGVSFGAFR